jgi:hypothetical protein
MSEQASVSISITIPASTAALLEKHCTILGVSHSTYLCGMIEDRERRHQRLMQESADAEVARMKRILSNA